MVAANYAEYCSIYLSVLISLTLITGHYVGFCYYHLFIDEETDAKNFLIFLGRACIQIWSVVPESVFLASSLNCQQIECNKHRNSYIQTDRHIHTHTYQTYIEKDGYTDRQMYVHTYTD